MLEIPATVARGFVMGMADLVPGVSGGTVALVFGIYRRLIASVRAGSTALGRLLKGDVKGAIDSLREVEWTFLIPLLGGILLAVATLSRLMTILLEDHAVATSGAFMGLILGSTIVAWGLLRTRDPQRLAILALAAAVTFVLLGLREGTSEATVGQAADAPLLAYLGAGAIAICAMILPGVSGSFLLVTLGMYGPVLDAVDKRDLLPVGVFALGCVVGLALFSQLLHWALSEHYDTVMAILVGLMLGSVRIVWPWPDGVDSTALGAPSDPVWLTIGLIVVGAGVVVAFDAVGRRLERRSAEDEAVEVRSI
jgi:putative membrane protein